MSEAIAQTIAQLESARQVVLTDASHYSAVVPGVLPIIGPRAHLEIRRWGADFLAESFASPVLAEPAKESLSTQLLPTLKELLDIPNQDEAVVRSVIQVAASIYGLVFRHIMNNPQNSQTWALMSSIKSNILRRFDIASIGIRICCIKFVQRVVQVQTPGLMADPRRPEQNEISSALVPKNHPLIPPSHLEPEASGLLDRLLNVFYEEVSNVLLIDATLNGLAILTRSRPIIAPKIINTVIGFNPFKKAGASMRPKDKVQLQSMERTTTAFLLNYSRRNQAGPLSSRILSHVARLKQQRYELFDEVSRKRGLPVEPTDGLDSAKRIRLGATANGRLAVPPLPPGPVSVAQLYTLTDDEALRAFDVKPIPIDLVNKITFAGLQRIDPGQLGEAINAIRARITDLSKILPPPQPPVSTSQPLGVDGDDDDDYEPEFEPTEDNEQILNKLDALPADDKPQTNLELGSFKLVQPPPLTYDEAEQLGKSAISRVFSMMSKLEEPSKAMKPGLNRLAGSGYDREAWVTVITRLATRASPSIKVGDASEAEKEAVLLRLQDRSLGDGIRETLWKYIIEDFRHRIGVAITWLNEEWYNDRISQAKASKIKSEPSSQEAPTVANPNYEKWVLKVLDAIMPYLDSNDKVLVRFLGEIPEVSQTVLERVKSMARDPDRVTLTVKAIYYLVAFKPPCKDASIDALEDLWRNYPDAKASVRPLLARVRPNVLEDQSPNGVKKEASAGPSEDVGPPTKTEPSPSAVAAAG